eukprot:GEMP01021141.1.p1 GENE.GEMP01021141.1~~GEMP01021141.1.p1  ORF type:complete len:503 (+),score=148.25 GEMP01021141.1:101-1609(+)
MVSVEADVGVRVIVHQESKVLDDEPHIIVVFDKPEEKSYDVDAYSLTSSETIRQKYTYVEYDSFFRFNAELMNPNKFKERWHWVMVHLVLQSDGNGGKKLAVHSEPTKEAPQVALETNMKMPTGRMDFGERARLRTEMQRLDAKRNDNIKAKAVASHELFIKGIAEQKHREALKQKERSERIAKEMDERLSIRIEQTRLEKEEADVQNALNERRNANIEEKMKRRAGIELTETKKLLTKQDNEKKEQEEAIAEARAQKQKCRAEEETMRQNIILRQAEREVIRDRIADEREERVEKKTMCLIAEAQSKQAARQRRIQEVEEKKLEKCHANWRVRGELFRDALNRQDALNKDAQAESRMVAAEMEEGDEEKSDAPTPTSKDCEKTPVVMDAVEQNMRQKIEAESSARILDEKRTMLFAEKERAKNLREVTKAGWRNDALEEASIKLRHEQQKRALAKVEVEENKLHAQHIKDTTRKRLDASRDENIRRKEEKRFQQLLTPQAA